MKELLAALLRLIESKSIPGVYKVLLGAAVLAVLLKLAGFPVVSYVETGVREAFERASILSHVVLGILVGSLMGKPLRAFSSAMNILLTSVFQPTDNQRRVLREYWHTTILGVILGCIMLTVRALLGL